MSDDPKISGAATAAFVTNEAAPSPRKTCGIVMPIAAMPDDYTAEHWVRVRKILERAIGRAGLTPQLVWENAANDIIQSKILHNIYENDVIICDVSGLNPNVMLETGLRLSTKKPTIIITDKLKNPPFDIGTIGYIEYNRDLEYNAIELFIEKIVKRISEVISAASEGNYISFVENYRFEVVTPNTVSVSSEHFLNEKAMELAAIARRLERASTSRTGSNTSRTMPATEDSHRYIRIQGKLSESAAKAAESEIDDLVGFHVCTRTEVAPGEYLFVAEVREDHNISAKEATSIIRKIVDEAEINMLFD